MNTVLIGSPIHRSPSILKAFLDSLDRINYKNISPKFYFIDDNSEEASKELLKEFAKVHKQTTIISSDAFFSSKSKYCEDGIHNWDNNLINRIASFKDAIIEHAKKEHVDYLFFIDSDMVIHPDTLKHLISRNVDIVSEIFWTDWHRSGVATPSIWLEDENNLVKKQDAVGKDRFFANRETASLYAKLRVPGIYPVGGLGALTLINKKSIQKGISFRNIDNLSFFGEDRHFCVRARALGLNLYVDTVYPAFHIFRPVLLERLPSFIKNGYHEEYVLLSGGDEVKPRKTFKQFIKPYYHDVIATYHLIGKKLFSKKRITPRKPRLTLMMLVHNEEGRFLEECIASVKPCLTNAVILDDASTDNTANLCDELLKGIPHTIIRNTKSGFATEYKVRKQLWNATIKTNPDWILVLDADEVLESKAITILPELMKNPTIDAYSFPLYDMWNTTHYRDDSLWCAHTKYRHMMLRYQPKYHYTWNKKHQHCGSFPKNALDFINNCDYPLRVKHCGWLRDEDKKRKYDRYMSLDPEGKYGSMAQYQSILDEHPHLVKFEESHE